MKKRLLAIAFLPTLAAVSSLHAAVIVNNNFDSVTAATYNGTVGQQFGADAVLGNATGNRNSTVIALVGVGGTQALGNSTDVAARSRGTALTTTKTNFSTYFKYNTPTNTISGFVGAGWALSAGTDGPSPFNGNSNDRFLVVLAYSSGNATLQAGGGLGSGLISLGGPTAALTVDNWYQLSFDLQYAGSGNWTISDASLKNWGADGITGGSTVLSLATASVASSTSRGLNLDNTTSAFAYFAGNKDRGVQTLDNLLAVSVPEPGTLALAAGAGAFLVFIRRRKRH